MSGSRPTGTRCRRYLAPYNVASCHGTEHPRSKYALNKNCTELSGGWGGIRTHEDLAALPLFESGALNRTMRPIHAGEFYHCLHFKVILERLQLQHFRNYNRLDLTVHPGSTLLYGANGAGKTNILEAIFTLATTKSFRARNDREMIDRRLNPDEVPFPFARLQADAIEASRAVRVEILIALGEGSRSDNGGSARKQFRLNGAARRASDVVGQLKAVLFSPADVDIVSGSPSARRRYLDIMLCQVDHSYLRQLQSYNRIVQQRNGVLSRIPIRSRASVLEFWDEKLLSSGSEIMLRRIAMMDRLSIFVRDMYRELAGGIEELEIAYSPNVVDVVGTSEPGSAVSDDSITASFRRMLESEARRSSESRVTTVGPHRDDLSLTVDGSPLQAFGSRGQHRTAALALRMAEARYIFDQTGEQPILLLDEALGELDDARRDHLLRFVRDYPQVMLTGTSADAVPLEFKNGAKLVHVESGTITE